MGRFVVFGAGAIGGVVGARLHQAGHDVVLIARGPHREAIARHGLRVQSPDRDDVVSIPVVGAPSELGWGGDEIVLLAVKSQQGDQALGALQAAAGPGVAVAILQNGVDNERRALRLFGRVYGVVVMCPANHLEPGVVQASSAPITGLLDVGRFPRGVDQTARDLVAAFNGSTFDARLLPDVMRWKYAKLLMNLGNAVQALCPPGEDANKLRELARQEGLRCLQASGIFPATLAEDRDRRGDRLQLRPVAGELRLGGSSWQSLQRSTGNIEADYLNGEIVLLGRMHGIPTPVNAVLQAAAGRTARQGRGPGHVPARALLAEIAARSRGA